MNVQTNKLVAHKKLIFDTIFHATITLHLFNDVDFVMIFITFFAHQY